MIDKVRVYDAPGILLHQGTSGQLTPGSAWRTLIDAETLSPTERDLAGEDSLFGWTPDTGVGRALVGVVKNPFSWLLLATELPIARLSKPLSRVASRLSVNEELGSAVPFLHRTNFSTIQAQLRGSSAVPVVEAVLDSQQAWKFRHAVKPTEALERWAAARSINLTKRDALTADKAAVVEQAEELLRAKFLRTFEDRMHATLVFDKNTQTAKIVQTPVKAELRGVTEAQIDTSLDQLGLREVADSFLEYRNRTRDELFYKNGKINVEALQRMRGSDRAFGGKGRSLGFAGGDQALQQIFGPDVAKAVASGQLSQNQFDTLVSQFDTVLKANADHYVPRNLFDFVDGTGQSRAPASVLREHQNGILGITANVRGRKAGQRVLSAETLGLTSSGQVVGPGRLERVFGSAVDPVWLTEQRNRYVKALANTRKRGTDVYLATEKSRFIDQWIRYDNQASRTYSLFIEEPSRRTIEAQRAVIEQYRDYRRKNNLPLPQERFRGDVADLASTYDEALAAGTLGGVSNADLLDQAYRLIPADNNIKREIISDLIVPRLTGRAGTDDFLGAAYHSLGKTVARSFVESDLGKAFANAGGPAAKLHDYLNGYARSELPRDAQSFSANVSRYLYGTTLGLNIPTALLNLVQPLVTTSRWVSSGDLATGYVRAFQQLSGYYADRIKVGANITDTAKLALVRKHIPLADLANIEGDITSSILQDGLNPRQGLGSSFRSLTDALLFPFRQTERFNRIVSAEAGLAHGIRNGYALRPGVSAFRSVDDLTSDGVESVRFVNQNSNFGSELVNTPTAFLKGPLQNPLLRQFLTFPLRSFTSPFDTGAVVGGGDNTLSRIGVDVLRGLAYSAVAVEVIRGVTGSDQGARYGFLETTGSLPNAFTDDRDGPFPTSPIFNVGRDVRTLLGGDLTEFFQQSLPRYVPGGVGIAKTLGLAPNLGPVLGPVNPQKTYVDWQNRNEDGTVNVYDSGQRLLRSESPTSLLVRGIAGSVNQSDIDGYIIKQRDVIREARQEALRRILANDVAGAQRVQQSFQQRYGIPLTISKAQIEGAQRLRDVGRTERLLEQLPPELQDAIDPRSELRLQGAAIGNPT